MNEIATPPLDGTVSEPASAAPASPPLPDGPGPLSAFEAQIAEHTRAVQALVDRVGVAETERDEQRRLREVLYEKIDAGKASFQFQLLRPLVQRLSSWHDLIGDWCRQPPQTAEGFAECLRLLQQQLAETLQLHGIETVSPAVGAEFDRRYQHVVATRPTQEASSHERVAELVQHGFVYFGQNERNGTLTAAVIRPARVITWKYEAPAAS